jgi:hypothetical protein
MQLIPKGQTGKKAKAAVAEIPGQHHTRLPDSTWALI